ncbi:MAG TPA: BlaI/MecI/CopY family transcriptional regulator [Vicinamibacterales bacterium]|jgi:predicted transcriptional regulator
MMAGMGGTPRPTKSELAILRVLWERGPQSVRAVQAALETTKPSGYTTVLKLMQIMTDKGLLERDDSVRPQLYKPRRKQEQTQKHLLRDFIDRAYGGSVKSLVMHAMSTKKPSQKDLDELEALLDRFEKGDV